MKDWRPTKVEMLTALWGNITSHMETRLSDLRERNDQSLDERKTAELRGRIAEIKDFLALGAELPVTPD